MTQTFTKYASFTLLASCLFLIGCSSTQGTRTELLGQVNLDTVKAGRFDTGKMWTFDYPPIDYFAKTYGFAPDAAWFEQARLSALRIPRCSASFVSEDGLVFTNHHCSRDALDAVNKQGENLPETGFFAPALADERRVPNYYADQLVLIEDVTEEVQQAFESGTSDDERVTNKSKAIAAIEQRYREKTKLTCNVVTFYNGGKFALYGYKRYKDVRLVFAPETAMGYFGGDADNFTYPRYDLDISFFRVYDDNGTPLKTNNFFKWSQAGSTEGEPVFVIGNPGRTNRLFTYAQLEFQRDVAYPYTLNNLNNLVRIYSTYIASHPEKKIKHQTRLYNASNSQKLYAGRVKGLHDPILMAKKRDFERTLKAAVLSKPEVTSQYSSLWREIEQLQKEKTRFFGEVNAFTFRGSGKSTFFILASDLVDYAFLMKLPEEQQSPQFRGNALDSLKRRIIRPDFEVELEKELLFLQLINMKSALGEANESFNKLLGGRSVRQAADELATSSVLSKKDQITALLNGNPDDVLNSSDPLIAFVQETLERAEAVREQFAEITAKEQARVQMLGKALYDVYGTSIPPDATFTLRIADGVVKGFPYNGTVAPYFTTFYGLYDRYYSFGKKDPWKLPDRWINPPPTFDMNTPLNFVSTNDIIGGNSGSPIVNKNLEIVGIAFDGNIESLPNDVIHSDEEMRCVGVHSSGILEAMEDIYKADRIVKELKAGKIVE